MKSTLVAVLFFLLFPFTIFTQESKEAPAQQVETPEEREKREFKEFKEFKERQNREAALKDQNANKANPNEKKWYVYMQGSAGSAATEFEKGKAQGGKLGFEYRILPFFGIGFGLGNNKLDLTSRDSSSGLVLAYLLLNAPYTTTTPESRQSAQTNRLFLAALLAAPTNYSYSYSTAQLDFNLPAFTSDCVSTEIATVVPDDRLEDELLVIVTSFLAFHDPPPPVHQGAALAPEAK
jgi:hypothetical protein